VGEVVGPLFIQCTAQGRAGTYYALGAGKGTNSDTANQRNSPPERRKEGGGGKHNFYEGGGDAVRGGS